ncbi:MAG: 3-phosphoshikimate 1-carboxyvinyltransferase [Parachlamydiaceae bacterium]|nr:3-phosphoshikimate 1-carboxyvinyltransferase [Parachlamydiaceae bacterium]
MDHYQVKKSYLTGEISVPASKSHTLRAILFGAMAHGKSIIHGHLNSTDTQAMIEACRHFGAKLDVYPDRIEIDGLNGKIEHTEDVINAGNSGIVLRFGAAIGALAKNPVVITGDHSIRHQRPVKPLLDGLSQLGVKTTSMRGDGYAPIIIQGPLKSGKVQIDGQDSQPVSALLIASAFAEGPIEINVDNPGEIPWISLTLNWLDRLGIPYENIDFKQYRLKGNCSYKGFEYHVPGDLSSAAFPIAAALVTNSEVTVKNVDMHDSQGDKELIAVFQQMGANIEIDEKNKSLHVKKGTALKGVSVDINDFVDAITILSVVACYAEGETHIYNAAIAKQKECNRINCIATELQKMGANITETVDGLRIRKSALIGADVESYNDHRMAMSLSVAAMGAEGNTKVSPVECISKTFPTFLRDFITLGADMQRDTVKDQK